MEGVFLKPRVSPLLAAGIERLLNMVEEDTEDVHEGLKALADEAGTITWEQYQRQRKQ